MNLFRSTPLLPCKEERRWIGPSKLVVSQRSVCGVCVCVNVSLENSCFFFQRGFLRVTRIYFNAISRPIQKSRPYSLQAPYSQQCFSKIQTLGKFVAQLIYKFTSLSELGRWVKSCSHLYLRKVFASACEINFSQWVSVVWEGWAFLWQEKSNVWERERVRREWRKIKAVRGTLTSTLLVYFIFIFRHRALDFPFKNFALSLSLRVYAQSTRCTQEILVLLLKQHAPNKRVESCVCVWGKGASVCVWINNQGATERFCVVVVVLCGLVLTRCWRRNSNGCVTKLSRGSVNCKFVARRENQSDRQMERNRREREREACINRDAGTEGDWTDSNPRAALFRFASYTRPAVCAGPSIWNEGGTTSSGPCINQLSSWRIYQ